MEQKQGETAWESIEVRGPDSAGVAQLILNRPKKQNALNASVYREIPLALSSLDADPNTRVIILAGNGRNFCAGIDLKYIDAVVTPVGASLGGKREFFRRHIKRMQHSFTAFELCSKPVVAAIHGACIGAGIDMVTACDLRYSTEDAKFSVKEVDLAITADLGSLQRLPLIVGYPTTMELALTARIFDGREALGLKLVNQVFSSKDELDKMVYNLAAAIAAKSPLAIIGTKAVLLKSRNCSVVDGLDYVATLNAAVLHNDEIGESMAAMVEKRNPVYSKL